MDIIPQDDMPRKQCMNPHCKQWFPATPEFFHRDSSAKDGLFTWCKPCNCKRVNEYHSRSEVREQRRLQLNEYHNRSEVKARASIWQQEYSQRPEVIERRRIYERTPQRLANQRLKHRTWYFQRGGRAVAVSARHRRQMLMREIPGSHTIQESQEQYRRQKGTCYYCGLRIAWGKHHEDHVIPLSRVGATDFIENIVITCPQCNLRKNNKLPHEFPEGGRLL